MTAGGNLGGPEKHRLDVEAWIREYLTHSFARLAEGLARRYQVSGEDAVQEALVRAWQRSAAGEEISSMDGWISATATNVARMTLRGRSAEERALRRLDHPRAEWPEEARLGPVADAVGLLPPRQREILVLHYYGDLDVAEIARMLAISQGTVKSALHRARATLATALAPHYQYRRTAVKGWIMAGSHREDYEFGLIPSSTSVVSMRSTTSDTQGFGTMMQMFTADSYRGLRMRVSCELRAIDVVGRTGLWMRVDGNSQNPLGFDNMENRPISGTTDTERVDVVLDIDPEATAIAFGVLLDGKGEVHISGFRFEEVPDTVPATSGAPNWLPDAPVNLSFGE